MKRMKLLCNKIWVLIGLLMLTLSGCLATTTPQEEVAPEEADDELPQRHADVPPVVESGRRYQLPVNTRIGLAGNYGELRPNHFHGGLDFKTDQSVGHPVFAFADGHVRRAAINAYGYGLVLYVEHPELGLTSVYGHLESFNEAIWTKIRARQVAEELNNADLTFGPDELPVKQGEVIAQSGNTGSSGGPHVHFELRNIPTDDDDVCYDPQMFFLQELKDTQAPRISFVYLYPQPGQGLANGQTTRQQSAVKGICASAGGKGGSLTKPLTAWGRVGVALKAYDYMDGHPNKDGVKEVRLYLEDSLIYHFRQDAFRFSETRYTNSVTDYAAWVGQRSMIMKSFIEPGNLLQQLDATLGNGLVNIDQERPYHFRYELQDAHGNLTTLAFVVQGVRGIVPEAPAPSGYWVNAGERLAIDSAGCHVRGGRNVFYTDVDFRFCAEEGVYTLGQRELPMHTWCSLEIDLPADTEHPEQLYLTNLEAGGTVSQSQYVAAEGERPARMKGRFREAGRYTVLRDSVAPQLQIVRGAMRGMEVGVTDEGSGVRRYRVRIDGQFVPFDMNNKARRIGHPALYGIKSGMEHDIEIEAEDWCGNRSHLQKKMKF